MFVKHLQEYLDTSIRVVLKPNKEEKLILPPGYIKDY